MGKIKIHEIAKKLNKSSKEIIEVANRLNINAKSHLSGIEEEEAKKIEIEITRKKSKNVNEKVNKKEEKKETPVIIRREVIISQEDNNKNEVSNKKEERTNKNVGFIERKNRKDYNIVYRNKPNKPMTVSELFGLNKEEPKKEEKKEITKKVQEPQKIDTKTEDKIEKVEIKETTIQKEKINNVTEKVGAICICRF